MSTTPASGTERTTTVVIGTGLSGLAVASELRRHGVSSIIVDGLDILGTGGLSTATTSLQRCDVPDPASLQERNEILRHLRNYAASHNLDVRNSTRAVQLNLVDAEAAGESWTGGGLPQHDSSWEGAAGKASEQRPRKWAVHTPDGVLLADHIVLTRCGQSQFRRMIADLGISVGQNLVAAMRAIGIYLVGVGDLVTPTPKEVLRQAKVVGQAISAKVYPHNVQAALTGSFAALPGY